jgi:hypothetical protein
LKQWFSSRRSEDQKNAILPLVLTQIHCHLLTAFARFGANPGGAEDRHSLMPDATTPHGAMVNEAAFASLCCGQ